MTFPRPCMCLIASGSGSTPARSNCIRARHGSAGGEIPPAYSPPHPDREGWLYLAVILDLFTRKVVGWAMRDHMRAELAIAALIMAIQRRRPGPGLIHHSDRGSQYAAGAYQDILLAATIVPSMS